MFEESIEKVLKLMKNELEEFSKVKKLRLPDDVEMVIPTQLSEIGVYEERHHFLLLSLKNLLSLEMSFKNKEKK